MEDFSAIYRILSTLRSQMDNDEPDPDTISADALGITQNRLNSLYAMLSDAGYVTGILITSHDNVRVVRAVCPRITLKGLEYLQENSMMKKAYRIAKGIKEVTPFI